jgi:hypothetical protein
VKTVITPVFKGPPARGRIAYPVPLTLLFLLFLGSCKSTPHMSDEGVANLDPIPAGTIDVEFGRVFSSAVEKRDVAVVFCPRDNGVYLEFKYQTLTYRQYWNLENRRRFREALETYERDYGARTLVDRPNRTRRLYGVFTGMTQWGYPLAVGNMVRTLSSQGYPRYELGYTFKQDSSRRETPYFTVFQRESEDVFDSSDDIESRSLNIFMYYTRAQARELVKLFDQDYLLSLIRMTEPRETTPDSDDY